MHILKVTQAYVPFRERGGPVEMVRTLARALRRRGHRVTVLTAMLDRNRLAQLGQRTTLGWQSADGGIETLYLPTTGHVRSLTLNPAVLAFRQRLHDFDIVHVYGLYDLLGPPIAAACRRWGIPYVVEPMGMFRPMDRAVLLKRLWHSLWGGTLLAGAAGLVASSELERSELRAGGLPENRIFLRPNPISPDELLPLPPRGSFRRQYGIATDEPLILFLSRLIARKGADLLIEAFARALPDRGVLIIAGPEGEPGMLDRLRELALRSGVQNRVRFTGPLYGEQRRQALADADLFALPSRYENFGNAAAEALLAGVPALITETCGVAELARGRGALVVRRQPAELAGALRRFFEHTALQQQLRAQCPEFRAVCDADRLAARQEDIYRTALQTRSRQPRTHK
jgi:glycosyltransferase involved in cell wall biosynthesis